MKWIKDRYETLAAAIGVKRFAIGGAIAIVAFILDYVASNWEGWPLGSTPQWIFYVIIVLSLVVWWLLNFATDLRLSNEPKISVSTEVVPGTLIDGKSSKWARINVTALSDADLRDCRAELLKVERLANDASENEVLFASKVPFHWSNKPSTEEAITIRNGLSHTADVVSAIEGTDMLSVKTNPGKPKLINEMPKHGRYCIQIAVSADECQTVLRSLILDWGGYNSLRLSFKDDPQ